MMKVSPLAGKPKSGGEIHKLLEQVRLDVKVRLRIALKQNLSIVQFCTFLPGGSCHNPPVVKGETMTIATAIAPSVQTLTMTGGRGERLYPLTASRPKPTFHSVEYFVNCLLNTHGRRRPKGDLRV
jgi:hypothetical protein